MFYHGTLHDTHLYGVLQCVQTVLDRLGVRHYKSRKCRLRDNDRDYGEKEKKGSSCQQRK